MMTPDIHQILKHTVIIAVLLLPVRISAPAFAAEKPEDVLSVVLKADFTYEIQHRYGHIHYTTPDPYAGECCTPARGYYSLDADPLVVVTSWKILKTHPVSAGKVTIDVRFHRLATTSGTDGVVQEEVEGIPYAVLRPEKSRQIVPLTPPDDVIVTYRVWKIKGHWMVVDPPIPRVNLPAMIESYFTDIVRLQETAAKERQEGEANGAAFHQQHIDYNRSQLRILEGIMNAQTGL